MTGEKADTKRSDGGALPALSLAGWAAAAVVGIAAVPAAMRLGLPNLAAAQFSTALFGLAGGLSQAFLLRRAGGDVGPGRGLLLAAVWALSCAAGVTPMFLTSGTPAKMALLTFASFAAAGALGGLAAARLMRSAFGRGPDTDLLPAVAWWAFGFGLAALSAELSGEALRKVLPAWLAWSSAAAAMALIIGAASALALSDFLGAGTEGDRFADRHRAEGGGAAGRGGNALYLGVLLLLVIPFYLNDLADIYVKNWRWWLWIDYTAVKLFPAMVILGMILCGKMGAGEFGFTRQPVLPFLAVFAVGTLAGLFIDQNGYALLRGLPGYRPLGAMPEIGSPFWEGVDLTAGLLMVGIVEEAVFRGYLHAFLSRFTRSSLAIVAVSAVVFGCIHWGGGFHKILVTGAIGAVFMMLYLRTRSLPALVLAHFAVNWIDFSGVIDKSIFRFF